MRRIFPVLMLTTCLLCLLGGSALADSLNRALLVGCDDFISQQSTAPSSANNVVRMAETLSGGAMNLETLVTRRDGISSLAELAELISDAFSSADEDDVNYFYISTHGVWNQSQPNAEIRLLLSDGLHEDSVSALELRALFDAVPGTKVLLIDACHSGAMIGKGVQDVFDNTFIGADYKVLCSSGGAEESWFWAEREDNVSVTGEGYFSGALVNALSAKGGFAADDNSDGAITLSELKRYLRLNHGASTVQSYPEEDEFILLSYDIASFSGRRQNSALDNISFEDSALSLDDPTINFSFTVLRPTQVAYQLVFQRRGSWDFASARLIWDSEERFGAYGDLPGSLSPGLKERSITLTQEDTNSYGYVLLQILTMSGSEVSVASSEVICVPPAKGDPRMSVTAGRMFCPAQHEELTFVVNHAFPCELTVTIETPDGELIRRLASRQSTRPQQLLPTGSSFTWTGLDSAGEMAPAGEYVIHVRAYVGDSRYESFSAPFVLAEPEG